MAVLKKENQDQWDNLWDNSTDWEKKQHQECELVSRKKKEEREKPEEAWAAKAPTKEMLPNKEEDITKKIDKLYDEINRLKADLMDEEFEFRKNEIENKLDDKFEKLRSLQKQEAEAIEEEIKENSRLSVDSAQKTEEKLDEMLEKYGDSSTGN